MARSPGGTPLAQPLGIMTETEAPTYRGVLLDLDGTLVDSNNAHAQAWHRALTENGHEVPLEEIERRIGMGGDNLLPSLLGIEKESELGTRLSERRGEIFRELLPHIRPFPEVRPLLEKMREAGLRPVIATSSPDEELNPLVEIAGIGALLEARTSADDAESSKPDPDIVQAALARLELPPGETVMLGDTPHDTAPGGGSVEPRPPPERHRRRRRRRGASHRLPLRRHVQ